MNATRNIIMMKTLFKIILSIRRHLGYRCTTTNNCYIATKVSQKNKTYVYSSRFSKHDLWEVKNIVETKYPHFSHDYFQIDNQSNAYTKQREN